MPQKIIIRSTESVIKIIENRPEIKELKDKEVVFFRGIIPQEKEISKAIDVERREVTAIISNPLADSYGDTINPKGIDWTRYDKNPVLLLQHDSRKSPIGTCVRHWRDDKDWSMATFKFSDKTQEARETFDLYEEKTQRAFSIGFRVKKWGTAITENDPDGYVLDEIEIFEVSAVTLPAVEDALTTHSFKSLYKSLDEKELKETKSDEEKTSDRLDKIEKLLNTLVEQSKSGDNTATDDAQKDTDTIKIVKSIREEAKNADKSLGKILKEFKILIKD